MIASTSKHPNCMYLWMNYIIGPEGNAKATEYFGEAPVELRLRVASHRIRTIATKFHADDEDYFSNVYYWRPQSRTVVMIAGRYARTTPSGHRPGRRSEASHRPRAGA